MEVCIKIENEHFVYKGKWLKIVESEYLNKLKERSKWYYATRDGQKAVLIIGKYKEQLVIIKQFRVPFKTYVYEFPAGLVDDGETIEETALREFKEETGYFCEISNAPSPFLSTSSGLTDEVLSMVFVDVKEGEFSPEHGDSEDINLVLLPLDKHSITKFLKEIKQSGGIIDSKLYLYLYLKVYD